MRRLHMLLAVVVVIPSIPREGEGGVLLAHHQGSSDPVSEGWNKERPFGGVDTYPVIDDGGTGIDAWAVDDTVHHGPSDGIYAFDLALDRNKLGGSPAGMVTNCTKSNALNYSMVFWDRVYNQVSKDYPDIKTDMALVDALTMWMVKNPEYFDVIVASNLFGDIITDLGAMLQGGMGFAAGGNINPEKEYPSMFEPIHGSAPKYEGKGIVNPIASIESIRMMLDHLGETEASRDVEAAISEILAAGIIKTRDMGGNQSTSEMGDAVRNVILAS